MAKTILIMAGGTGGHIFPGLAVAEVLAGRGWRVAWMGAKTGMEAQIVPDNGYEMAWIDFQGVRGKGVSGWLALPGRLLRAFWQSGHALARLRPDVVLGMGGYIAFPGGVMAALAHRPLVIHEQNAVAGTTTRWLAKLADRVLTSFPGGFSARQGAIVTGNPIRSSFMNAAPPQSRFAQRQGRLHITVLGGSLGARALNETLPRALALLPESERPEVVHQTGKQHQNEVQALYREVGVTARCVAFMDDVAAQLIWSDLVICRSGATTLAELAAIGVASILVPFPFAIDDHQTRNAQWHAHAGAAILLAQSELSAERLAGLLRSLDRAQLSEMAGKARALGKPDAARRVADICELVATTSAHGPGDAP